MSEPTKRPWRMEAVPHGKLIQIFGGKDFDSWVCNFEEEDENGPVEPAPANAILIVKAVNFHDELVEALQRTTELAEQWASGVGRSHPDHEVVEEARRLLAELERQEAAHE